MIDIRVRRPKKYTQVAIHLYWRPARLSRRQQALAFDRSGSFVYRAECSRLVL